MGQGQRSYDDCREEQGKGGHQIIRIGGRWTTVKTGEIKPGLLQAMLDQLGMAREEF